MRDLAAGLTRARRPTRGSTRDNLAGTGERARVARDQLALAREHLEQARRRLQRAKDRDRDPQ
ncbi:MAG TPA: hypothetical protein VGL81_04710 [Polyangiaceae bacterium]